MAFQQALSGLNSASKAIDSTSHNIANASTIGYKASTAHFGDVYAASLAGAGASQIGIGVNLSAVQQQFTQGNITATNNPLDISINGAGFFKMDSNGATSYTRNGQFHLDKNGYVVNDQALKLTGYAALSGVVVPSTPTPIQISASDLPPIATGGSASGSFTGVKANLNLDSRKTTPTGTFTPAASQSALFTPDPLSYNYSTALDVYDTLGNAHTLTMFMRKDDSAAAAAAAAALVPPVSPAGVWDVHFTLDGSSEANMLTGSGGRLVFDSTGKLASPTDGKFALSIDLGAVMAANGESNGAVDPLAFNVDFSGSTQFGSAFGTNRLEQDGYAAGHLVGLSIADDGVIQGRYSNGQTFAQGQIVLANFTNPNGLQALGNNQWTETSISGPALVGSPNTSSLGTLSSSTVEESNVDLTAELVNLISQQRSYQANAQSIKTQDSIMQTLVNLR